MHTRAGSADGAAASSASGRPAASRRVSIVDRLVRAPIAPRSSASRAKRTAGSRARSSHRSRGKNVGEVSVETIERIRESQSGTPDPDALDSLSRGFSNAIGRSPALPDLSAVSLARLSRSLERVEKISTCLTTFSLILNSPSALRVSAFALSLATSCLPLTRGKTSEETTMTGCRECRRTRVSARRPITERSCRAARMRR